MPSIALVLNETLFIYNIPLLLLLNCKLVLKLNSHYTWLSPFWYLKYLSIIIWISIIVGINYALWMTMQTYFQAHNDRDFEMLQIVQVVVMCFAILDCT